MRAMFVKKHEKKTFVSSLWRNKQECRHLRIYIAENVLVFYSYVFVCHSYVPRRYSYITRMLLVCIRMYSYELVCIRMYSCGVLVTIDRSIDPLSGSTPTPRVCPHLCRVPNIFNLTNLICVILISQLRH